MEALILITKLYVYLCLATLVYALYCQIKDAFGNKKN